MFPILTWPRYYRHSTVPIVVIALLVGSLTPGLAKPVAADGSYSISGTVTGPDGITGLPGIGVYLNGTNDLPPFGPGTETASDGTYSLTGLPAGDYTVSFQSFSSTYVDGCYGSGGFTSYEATCAFISVPPDATDINVSLPVGYSISGTVTGPDGITGLEDIGINFNVGDTWLTARATAADGTYSLMVLPGSNYRVAFQDPNSTYVDGCYGSGGFTADPTACASISVPPDATDIDVAMPIGQHIRGTVTGPDGITGLPGIEVNANAGTRDYGSQTASDGTYSLTVLSGSDYALSFQDPSSTYASGWYASGATGNFSVDQNAYTPVGVATSDVTGIDVTMPLGYSLSGRVTGPDGITGLQNIQVNANAGILAFGTQTASDGTYSLAGLVSSDYTVSFQDPNSTYVDGCYGSGGFTSDQNACASISVPPDATDINVAMPLRLHITGTVTGPNGPLANVDVHAKFGTADPYNGWSTDANGHFSLTVFPGTYNLWFYDWSSTYVSGCYATGATGNVSVDPNACTPVTVPPDATGINVRLRYSQTITFAQIANRSIYQSPFTVSASASSGLPVTFSTQTPSVCRSSGMYGRTITLVGLGTCAIAASQVGNSIYGPAPTVTQEFSVIGLSQTISFAPLGDRWITQSPFKVSASASSGLAVTFSTLTPSVCTAGGKNGATITLVGPGTCTVAANQAGNNIYGPAPMVVRNFQVSRLSQTISFAPLGDRWISQSPFNASASASSGLPVTFTSSTPSVCTAGGRNGATISLVGPGTCTVQADQAGNAVYNPAPSLSRSFGVRMATQTINFAPLGDRWITQSPFHVSATATSGLPVTFSTLTASVCTAGGTNGTTITLVGPGTCTVQADQAGNAVYNPAPSVSRSFGVHMATQTINFGGLANRKMAQSPVIVGASASSGLPVTFSTLTPSVCTASGTNGTTITLVGPGTCTVQADQAGNAVYNPAPPVSRSFTVR